MFPRNETGTWVHSPKPPFYETALLSPPKGPKTAKIQDRPSRLKFSSEIENFKRAAYQPLIFVGILKVETENFERH